MRKLDLGLPLGGNVQDWLVDAVREIEQASNQQQIEELFDAFTVTNAPATPVRTLDASTATLGDLRNFVATLVMDVKSRGQARAV